MRAEYCQECGHKNLYEVSKPKFCSKCGQPLSSFVSRSSAPVQNEVEQNFEIDDPDGEDIFHVPDIGKFEYEISHDNSKRTTLGQLANSEGAEAPEKLNRSRRITDKSKQSKSKWDMAKQTMKECSSNTEPTDIE